MSFGQRKTKRKVKPTTQSPTAKSKKFFTVEKKLIAQIRFFEELHVIRDERGETIFTGTEEMAKRILKLLKTKGLRK